MDSTSIELLGYEPETGALHFFGVDVALKFSDGVSKAQIVSREKFTTLFVAASVPKDRKIEGLSLVVLGRERQELKLPRLNSADRDRHSLHDSVEGVWFGQVGLPDPQAGSAWHIVLKTSPR
jgi:hypothetical protein